MLGHFRMILRRAVDGVEAAREEHLRVMRKAQQALPYDEGIRAAVRAAERAMRGEGK